MSEVPKALKPYLFHGVELDWSSGSKNAKGDCPFCGKVGKFGVNTEDGRYGCFSCDGGTEGGKGGNVLTFLRALWSVSFDATSAAAIQELAAERKVSPDALIAWGVAKSITTADWIVPGHSADSSRSIGQLYRYALSQGKRRLLATPGVPIRMFGLTEWNKSAETVYVCEGPWDGMALWDALRTAKQTDEGLVETSNRKSSLLATAAVVSVPGCGSFQKPWASFINGRKVVLMFDNDHPTEKNPVPPSLAGATRTASMLKGDVSALRWGPEGYNKHLPNGYDVRDHLSSGQGLTTLLNMVEPLSKSANVAAGGDETADLCLECPDWKTLINAWRRALKWTPGLELALSAMLASVVSTKTAGDQLWVKVVGPPACGKSTLCEALSTARRYVEAKSTIRGFHSGFGEEGEDNSLLSRVRDKTLVIKDGDTLLQSPNLGQILSEARDIYDRVSRTHYRNRNSRSYEGVNLTMILCGTSSLRSIDQSELGERFLDCVIMDRIDEDLEDEILWRKINRVQDEIRLEATGDNPTAASPDMLQAMGLTGGYVNLLRETAVQRFAELEDLDDVAKKRLKSLGKFVAIMRARPSLKQEEVAEREFAARLVSQLARMAMCLAVVTNRPRVDGYVLERVSRIAFDTARGVTMALASRLREAGSAAGPLALRTGQKDETTRKLLRFLGKIDVVETYKVKDSGSVHWRLTGRFAQLWDDVHKTT